MAIVQAANHQTPDAGQGGSLAVSSDSNTGHGSTTALSNFGVPQTKSCRWHTFAFSTPSKIRLQFNWSEDGNIGGGAPGTNLFRVQYSIDGGSNWTDALSHGPFIVGPASGSVDIVIPNAPISQIQVRDTLTASSDPSDTCSVTGAISGLQLEVTPASPSPVWIG